MKKNNQGFTLVLALGLSLVIVLLALLILEYIIPYSKNVRGIEHSSAAYYQWNTAIEDALLYLKENTNPGEENTTTQPNFREWSWYNIVAKNTRIPEIWHGESSYDPDWNQIAVGKPIQLQYLWEDINWNNVKIFFRVPDLNGILSADQRLSNTTVWSIVKWQMSVPSNLLFTFGSGIESSDICGSNVCNDFSGITIGTLQGRDLEGNRTISQRVGNYYDANCESSGDTCVVKFWIVNNLETTSWVKVPYLEWRMDFGTQEVPLRYSRIIGQWKKDIYKKQLELRIPQQTLSEAFDFTVFQ